MRSVDVASESSFDSDFAWDIDQQVEEDGDSDDEDEQRSRLSSNKSSVCTAAVPVKVITVDFSKDTPPPEVIDVLPPDRTSQTTKGVIDQNTSEPKHTGHNRIGEGGVITNTGSGSKSRGHGKNVRATALWSKLRSIAYITSMQAYSRERQKAYNLLTLEYVAVSEGEFASNTAHEDVKPALGEAGANDAAWLQGNLDMYSTENLKKRKRLKEAPVVQAKIKDLWTLATSNQEGDKSEECLSKGDFLDIMVKLHVLIIFPPVDLLRAMANAMKDWEKDNAGLDAMNLDRFIDSMFELVDIWTETVEEQEYLDLLDLITTGITKVVPRIGSLCWKSTEEIKYDPRITKVALTMDDLVDRAGEEEEKEEEEEGVRQGPEIEQTGSQGANRGLYTIHSFVEAKERTSDAKKSGTSIDRLQRREIAVRRWKKAFSAAMMLGRGGNAGLYKYITKRKNKQGTLKAEKLLMSIVKMYKAKAQVEAKMALLEREEGTYAPGKSRKHHRLDRFLLQYHIRQFGTQALARKKLRQFVASVSQHGCSHPRITLFAKLSGIPVAEDGNGKPFRPFALSDYFLPIVTSLVPAGEDLDHFMGSGKEPRWVARNIFIGAVLRVLKSVPETSKTMATFYQQISAISDVADQKRAQEQAQGHGKRTSAAASQRSRPSNIKRESTTGNSAAPSLTSRMPSARECTPKSSREHGHRVERGGRKYVDLDEALLAVVPLWEAEESWRLWNHTITVAVLTRRWIKRFREADTDINEGLGQISGRGSYPPSPSPKQTPRSGILPPVTSPNVSPRTPVEYQPGTYQGDRSSRGPGDGQRDPSVRHLDSSPLPREERRPSPNGALLPSIDADSSRLPSIGSLVSSTGDSLHVPGTREADRGSSSASTGCLSDLHQVGNLKTGGSGRTRRPMPHVPSLANVMPTKTPDG